MTTRTHHQDLEQPICSIIKLTFKERMNIQLEMINDHAYLNQLDIESAVQSWVEKGWAKKFGDVYKIS
jgi:hypothetical protein